MKKLLLILLFLPLLFSYCQQNDPTPNNNSISGCTNPAAPNYDNTATADDGSCILPAQEIPGLQLGDAYNGGTIFYLDGNGGGMIFQKKWGVGCATGPYNHPGGGAISLGSGYNNTSNMANSQLVSHFEGCYDFISSSAWYIPSISELELLFDYAYSPYWDSINHPGAIRGFGYYNQIIWSPTEIFTTYGNEFPTFIDTSTVGNGTIATHSVSSSSAGANKFYGMRYEAQGGVWEELNNLNVNMTFPVMGVKNF